jgi:hypothetical protein
MNLSTVNQWKKKNISTWICNDIRSVGWATLSRVVIGQVIFRRAEVLNESHLILLPNISSKTGPY